MQPTWGTLAAGTGALFLVILAFLAGRVRGGNDPALRDAQPASAATQQVAPSQDPSVQSDPQLAQPDDTDPGFAPPVTHAS